ncbi:hypothetical protein CDL15_Pgr013416 [Punica granatum]|uniref:Glycosyltransferase n=1 Tax=Punica granatum TaxID=22663 RepID=A0A218W0Z8_PUNGR|nr:hypothetical protein CDL15_Pgr013416 [Punica granatum]PKI61446.1 hypothetical protein CRG98_018129 [Punica granatum]
MADTADDKLHIVMFPWLAFGHMIPYLELTKHFGRKGHRVSFLSTPRNIDRLPGIPLDLVALVEYVKIPLPAVENLPETAEATSDLPYDKIQYLKIAHDKLLDPVAKFLKSSDADWIIYDFAAYWIGPIARELSIKSAQFSIFFASSLAFMGPTWSLMGGDYRKAPEDYTVAPKWIPFQTSLAFRLFEIKRIFDSFDGNASGVTDIYRFGAGQESADLIMVRSSYEVQPEWLKLLGDLIPKPVLPVGQLPPGQGDYGHSKETDEWQWINEWLDSKERGSVVYIAFGTESKPTQVELTQIALGLEKSRLPFFWVLKTQLGSSDVDRVELPDGFMERIKGRGLVWTSWAPQLKVLAHDSVGGFLSHCGGTSVVEAMSLGKPLIMFPLLSDQALNARLLEEKQMGHPILRNESDGSFTSDSVAQSLRLVMVEEEGKVYREKVKEMRSAYGNMDIQNRYIDNLLNHLKANRPVAKIHST